jgi:hypothetical protein
MENISELTRSLYNQAFKNNSDATRHQCQSVQYRCEALMAASGWEEDRANELYVMSAQCARKSQISRHASMKIMTTANKLIAQDIRLKIRG